jgi:hypothetical protein
LPYSGRAFMSADPAVPQPTFHRAQTTVNPSLAGNVPAESIVQSSRPSADRGRLCGQPHPAPGPGQVVVDLPGGAIAGSVRSPACLRRSDACRSGATRPGREGRCASRSAGCAVEVGGIAADRRPYASATRSAGLHRPVPGRGSSLLMGRFPIQRLLLRRRGTPAFHARGVSCAHAAHGSRRWSS